jgi:hypothetical protein
MSATALRRQGRVCLKILVERQWLVVPISDICRRCAVTLSMVM